LAVADCWVYIISNRPNGTLYVGVTDNLREGSGSIGKAWSKDLPNDTV
jgi:hypothetical protein